MYIHYKRAESGGDKFKAVITVKTTKKYARRRTKILLFFLKLLNFSLFLSFCS